MNRPRKYNKDIEIDYRYENSKESQEALDKTYELLFSELIADAKKLKRFYASDEFKKLKTRLKKERSILYDYISFH